MSNKTIRRMVGGIGAEEVAAFVSYNGVEL